MKITIAAILVALAIIGWKLQDAGPGSNHSLGSGAQSTASDAAAIAGVSAGPDWMPFESAIKTGESTGRPSMIFIYADWCPWCRKTFNETFTDEIVLRYLKENFQVVKLNTDSPDAAIVMNGQTITEAQLSQILGATGLPTYVFLDNEGQPITKAMGFYDAEAVMGLLTSVAGR